LERIACGVHFRRGRRQPTFAQGVFEAQEFVFAFGVGVDFEARSVRKWNLYGSAAFDLAENSPLTLLYSLRFAAADDYTTNTSRPERASPTPTSLFRSASTPSPSARAATVAARIRCRSGTNQPAAKLDCSGRCSPSSAPAESPHRKGVDMMPLPRRAAFTSSNFYSRSSLVVAMLAAPGPLGRSSRALPVHIILVFFSMVLAAILSFAPQLSAQSMNLDKDAPVTLYKNARIYTNDPQAPWASAMLVRGEEILVIGDEDEVSALAEKGTGVVDLSGHFVMPGFNDAHVHLGSAGQDALAVRLHGAAYHRRSAKTPRCRRRATNPVNG